MNRDPGLALSQSSGGSRAANLDGAPRKHAAFHSSRAGKRKAADGKFTWANQFGRTKITSGAEKLLLQIFLEVLIY
jgi:hypothetical protein